MRYLSVCSGIEAASVAWEPLGWEPVAFAEIDKFPSAVLAHRFPHVPNWGDMSKFQEWPDADVSILVGGTPCQSFSVAGLRKGLADPRGNLALVYLAVAARYRPRWILWENVPGVLSSNDGRDFGAFLGALGQLGYGWAYRVLDAQYVRTRMFGGAVPQRRRRVFVVGYLGDWRPPAAVFLDGESLRGDPPPRREPGQRAAPTLAARTRGGGGLGTDAELDGALIPAVSNPLTARMHKGINTTLYEGQTPLPIAIQERAVSENPDNGPQGAGYRQDGVAYTLEARHHVQAVAFHNRQDPDVSGALPHPIGAKDNGLAVAFDLRGREGGAMPEGPHDTANIRSASGGSSRSYIAQPWAVRRLTPLECERLQGLPDGWTDVPYRNKPAADGPRYKALGNSMAVNVMEWIGERIALVERVHTPTGEEVAFR